VKQLSPTDADVDLRHGKRIDLPLGHVASAPAWQSDPSIGRTCPPHRCKLKGHSCGESGYEYERSAVVLFHVKRPQLRRVSGERKLGQQDVSFRSAVRVRGLGRGERPNGSRSPSGQTDARLRQSGLREEPKSTGRRSANKGRLMVLYPGLNMGRHRRSTARCNALVQDKISGRV